MNMRELTSMQVKKSSGLVSWFLLREILTIKDALEMERRTGRRGKQENEANSEIEDVLDIFDDTSFVDLQNGESRVLL